MKTILIFSLIFHVSLSFPSLAFAETRANGGQGSAKKEDLKYSCQISAAFRLTLASMKCDCNAPQSIEGGELPNDTGTCASPSKAVQSSGKTGLDYELGARAKTQPKVSFPKNKVDCSAFVTAALCRAGTPFMPGKKCPDMTTKAMVQAIEKGESCFEPVQAGHPPNLHGGEIVVYANGGGKSGVGHTFAVDRTTTDCENVSIIQSASSKKGVGISKLNGKGGRPDVQGMAEDEVRKVNCGHGNDKGNKVKVVRFNANKPGCNKVEPTELEKEACVKQCDVGRMIDRG